MTLASRQLHLRDRRPPVHRRAPSDILGLVAAQRRLWIWNPIIKTRSRTGSAPTGYTYSYGAPATTSRSTPRSCRSAHLPGAELRRGYGLDDRTRPRGTLTIFGAIARSSVERWRPRAARTPVTGYTKNYQYDTRFHNTAPPKFLTPVSTTYGVTPVRGRQGGLQAGRDADALMFAAALILVALVGVTGLAIGSFLNVVVYRVPAGMSVVHPRSACPNCGHEITRAREHPAAVVAGAARQVQRLRRSRSRSATRSSSSPAPRRSSSSASGSAPQFAAASTLPDARSRPCCELVAFLYLAAISHRARDHRHRDARAAERDRASGLRRRRRAARHRGAAARATSSALGAHGGGSRHPVRRSTSCWRSSRRAAWAWATSSSPACSDSSSAPWAGVSWRSARARPSCSAGVFSIILLITRRAGRKSGIPFGPWMLLGAWVGVFAGQAIAGGYLAIVGLL